MAPVLYPVAAPGAAFGSTGVPAKMDGFLCALGLMTEKDIRDGKSASLHGQGIIGEWAPLVITKSPGS